MVLNGADLVGMEGTLISIWANFESEILNIDDLLN